MEYKKVTFASVKKEIREHGMFKGFAVGAKVSNAHFFSGWCLAVDCELTNIQQAEQFRTRMRIQAESNYRSDRLAWYKYK